MILLSVLKFYPSLFRDGCFKYFSELHRQLDIISTCGLWCQPLPSTRLCPLVVIANDQSALTVAIASTMAVPWG